MCDEADCAVVATLCMLCLLYSNFCNISEILGPFSIVIYTADHCHYFEITYGDMYRKLIFTAEYPSSFMACNEISYVTNMSIFVLVFLKSVFVCTFELLLIIK